MPRYLVRVRNSSLATLSRTTRSLSPGRRSAQVAEVSRLRQNDPEVREIPVMIGDYHGKLLHGAEKTPLTGLQFVEMTARQAEMMSRENPQMVVLRDQPITLIAPQTSVLAAKKMELSQDDLWHLADIGLGPEIRNRLTVTGEGVTIAVLDTGVDETHPEIAGRVKGAVRFDTSKWQNVPQPNSVDTLGHGTHVTGLICGKRVGVAPGAQVWNAMMIPNGTGMLSDFILAMEWAGQQADVQIANISAGIPGWVDGMQDAVGDLLNVGVLPIVAVGNEGPNHTRSPGNYSEVLSVGASNQQHKIWSLSGGGRLNPDSHVWIVPDVVAPGENVTSCVMGGGYEAWFGTSMATPIVSGLAALLLQKYRDSNLNVFDLQEMLLEKCVQFDGIISERQGKGLIQLHSSLQPTAAAASRGAMGRTGTKVALKQLARASLTKKSPVKKTAVKKTAVKKAPVKKTSGASKKSSLKTARRPKASGGSP
jgi:subtilisin family serine protease